MTYFNTTHISGTALKRARATALTQEDRILRLFYSMPDGTTYSPSQVHRLAFSERTPVTSVRRAMTNLTRSGRLERTDETRTGAYGRPEYTWRVAR